MTFANFSFLDTLNIDFDVKERISQYLYSVVKGSKDALVSPIAKEKSPTSLLSEFNKVFDSNLDKMNSDLLNLEMDSKSKFGPRSIASPWKDRSKSFFESFDPDKLGNLSELEMTGRPRLRPLSLTEALKLLKNSTNSSLPFFKKKGLVKDETLDNFDSLLKRKDPCILYTRTQEQGKTRDVWGYPIADTLNEMRFYPPLLEYQRRLDYRSALSNPIKVSESMTKLIVKAVKLNLTIFSIDFSRYDRSVRRKLQRVAFKYIKSLYQAKYHMEIEYIAERFNTIGIVTPEGIIDGEHGVPSGSTFTNEVDSIIQVLIAKYFKIKDEDFQVQGDDGVYILTDDLIEAFSNKCRSLGLEINEDKSFKSRKFAVYLRSLFHIDYIDKGIIHGIYPIYRALNRIIHQERWSTFEDFGISGKDYYSIRAISIMENCKYHPLFRELVKFVLENDKYSLDFSDQGLSKYVQMLEVSKGAGEILNHQYGDDVSGIKNFETVKVIKELS